MTDVHNDLCTLLNERVAAATYLDLVQLLCVLIGVFGATTVKLVVSGRTSTATDKPAWKRQPQAVVWI